MALPCGVALPKNEGTINKLLVDLVDQLDPVRFVVPGRARRFTSGSKEPAADPEEVDAAVDAIAAQPADSETVHAPS